MKTRICEKLGIEYPIIQAPMNWISGPNLVAAVSNAGGLGTLQANGGWKDLAEEPDKLAERVRLSIRKTKSLTKKPFAFNLSASKDQAQQKFQEKVFQVMVEEKVAAAVVILGSPDMHTRRLKDAGIFVLHAITTPDQAKRCESVGVDAVIAEGYEGGGHIGNDDLTTLTLIPQTVDAVKIPVVAGGGIGDARGFVAALALGAEAVYMGTRFIASAESDAHPDLKKAIVEATCRSTLALGRKSAGMFRRLRNEMAVRYMEMELAGAPAEDLDKFMNDYTKAGRQFGGIIEGDLKQGNIGCGQVAGLVNGIMSASDIIQNVVREASDVKKRLDKIGIQA